MSDAAADFGPAETGTVASFATVVLAPPGTRVPYTVAYADFGDRRLFARLDGSAAVGVPVRLVAVDDDVEQFRFQV